MKKLISRLIARYGSEILISQPNASVQIKAFFQPVTSKSWQNMERMIPAGGELLRGQYLLIADADSGIAPADVICCGPHWYCVRRMDEIRYRDETLFLWGLCVEVGEDDPWFS